MTQSPTYSDCILKILEEIENEATSVPFKPKSAPKNYMKENRKRLKEIQERAKQKSALKQPLQPIKAFTKYSLPGAQPLKLYPISGGKGEILEQVKDEFKLPRTAGPYRTQPPASACLSTKSENFRSAHHYKSLPQLNPISHEEKVCKYLEKSSCTKRNENILPSKSSNHLACPKQDEKCEIKCNSKHKPGQIPSYLTERKKQWELEKEKQLKLSEEVNIPPGHTLLPDEERMETLELLKKNQEELLQSLASLPVRNDTLRLQQYKEGLERQLAKVEEGIKIFSRPKVLIKNDT